MSVAERLAQQKGTTLVLGRAESRKGVWWDELADELLTRGVDFELLSADPGRPVCGPPGAVALAHRVDARWVVRAIEALCTLDAARFRLPLILAAARVHRVTMAPLVLVDAPGITRGMAGAELVTAFIDQLDVEAVVLLDVRPPELPAYSVDVIDAEARPEQEAKAHRIAARSQQWKEHLEDAVEVALPSLPMVGAPPPLEAEEAWEGRQVAALDASGKTLALGECRGIDGGSLRIVAPPFPVHGTKALLVRDARRDAGGALRTAKRLPSRQTQPVPDLDGISFDASPRPPVASLATAKALLVNGVFGDPLLHVRMRHQKRSLLFDLGDTVRLPARIVHQVTDVFLSHAHFDHIGGFLWFLRSCIGSPRLRRVFGPPGTAEHLAGMIAGIRWDRVGERGPVFEVSEVFSGRLERHRLRAGEPARERLDDRAIGNGVLLEEPELEVRAVELDHGIPVLAFALVERRVLHIRKDRLEALGLAPGSWLGELKRSVLDGRAHATIALPNGERREAGELANDLVLSRPGGKLVYATDLDDSEANRKVLAELAWRASFFYCEASFLEKDARLARATQHLTARAAGEIAKAADVERLVPFHFSKRYEKELDDIYAEIAAAFPGRIVTVA